MILECYFSFTNVIKMHLTELHQLSYLTLRQYCGTGTRVNFFTQVGYFITTYTIMRT